MTFVFLDEENDLVVGTVNDAQVYRCDFGHSAHRQGEMSPGTDMSPTANVATKMLEQLDCKVDYSRLFQIATGGRDHGGVEKIDKHGIILICHVSRFLNVEKLCDICGNLCLWKSARREAEERRYILRSHIDIVCIQFGSLPCLGKRKRLAAMG